MTLNALYAGTQSRWSDYEPELNRAFAEAGLDVQLSCDFAPEVVDYIIYSPSSSVKDFTPFTRLKAVLNLAAGVETITGNKTLKVPLARLVDEGLTQGMVEWVTGHTLRHHLGMDAQIINPAHDWVAVCPPLSRSRTVTVLGLGTLGLACAEALAALGFNVAGWSRSPKQHETIKCYSGDEGLKQALAHGQICVLLLPSTPDTANTLNAETLALMPKGSFVINPGRGPLIDDAALLSALDTGQIAHATLDVFRIEPLPAEDPYWAHPQVTVTPHIASETRAETSAGVVAENIRRCEAGEELLHLVDRTAGY
ncbi:glyoxylate/hydroxypyruvate reductase A [Lentibacter algarum]|uniref:2-hydroxyacid dehydrogenase n=1 Tax=Lentibacter algarum TaxID=576131 RepID=UPI001C0784F9|nr:glyoxylate/hydroxypyruvate reductase A [Lentibacter algarum]MBU2980910.1 glyoxylate/hydroxypyruvate reductase A [Lentibacter algarum]